MNTTTIPTQADHTKTGRDTILLMSRILLAALFVMAGVNKLSSVEGTIGYIASVGLPLPELVYMGTLALEIGAGLMLAIGLQTRFAAIALGVFSIAAALIFHSNFADPNEITAFLKNLAIGGGMFALATAGSGRFGIQRS